MERSAQGVGSGPDGRRNGLHPGSDRAGVSSIDRLTRNGRWWVGRASLYLVGGQITREAVEIYVFTRVNL